MRCLSCNQTTLPKRTSCKCGGILVLDDSHKPKRRQEIIEAEDVNTEAPTTTTTTTTPPTTTTTTPPTTRTTTNFLPSILSSENQGASSLRLSPTSAPLPALGGVHGRSIDIGESAEETDQRTVASSLSKTGAGGDGGGGGEERGRKGEKGKESVGPLALDKIHSTTSPMATIASGTTTPKDTSSIRTPRRSARSPLRSARTPRKRSPVSPKRQSSSKGPSPKKTSPDRKRARRSAPTPLTPRSSQQDGEKEDNDTFNQKTIYVPHNTKNLNKEDGTTTSGSTDAIIANNDNEERDEETNATTNINDTLITKLMETNSKALTLSRKQLNSALRQSRVLLHICTSMPVLDAPVIEPGQVGATPNQLKTLPTYIESKVTFIKQYPLRHQAAKGKQEICSVDLDAISHVVPGTTDIPAPYVAYIPRSVEAFLKMREELDPLEEFVPMSYKAIEAPKSEMPKNFSLLRNSTK